MRWIVAMTLTAGVCLAGCSKTAEAPADANRPPAQSVAPKAYYPPETICRELEGEYSPVHQGTADAFVDWSVGRIVVTGMAKAADRTPQQKVMAFSSAPKVATRNALLAAQGVLVDSRGRFDKVRQGTVDAEGTVAGHEIVGIGWDANILTATATVTVPMYGISGIVRLDGVPVEKPADRRAIEVLDPVKEEADLIVIDARGVPLAPCLLPRIVDEKGRTLFDATLVPPEELLQHHLAVFVATLRVITGDPAASATRPADLGTAKPFGSPATGTGTGPAAAGGQAAGAPPTQLFSRRILLKATTPRYSVARPAPAWPTTLVLPDSELETLFRHADAAALLKAGRLVIVVDEPTALP